MVDKLLTLRSNVTGNRPTGRSPGELYVNFADSQLGVVNAASTNQDLLAVRVFSATATYKVGDHVLQSGNLYRANAASAAGSFIPANWDVLSPSGAQSFIINGPVATFRNLFYQTSYVNRFVAYLDNAAESGGNVGSNYAIGRYSDAGVFIDAPFGINRATGQVSVNSLLGSGPIISRDYLAAIDNTSAWPPTGSAGLWMAWNHTGGNGEADFFNAYTGGNPTVPSFSFYQMNTASSATLVASLGVNSVIPGTLLVGPGASINTLVGGGSLAVRQDTNNGDTIVGQRATDTAPAGSFLRLCDAANTVNIFQIDINGVLTTLGNIFGRILQSQVFTVAGLPAGALGQRAMVSDSNATAFNTPPTSGGSNKLPVFHNGTAWMIG